MTDVEENKVQSFFVIHKNPFNHINLKNRIAEKIGYLDKFFYLGMTEDDKNIYQGYGTTSLVGKDIISLCGHSENIEKAHRNIERLLNIKLKNYQK